MDPKAVDLDEEFAYLDRLPAATTTTTTAAADATTTTHYDDFDDAGYMELLSQQEEGEQSEDLRIDDHQQQVKEKSTNTALRTSQTGARMLLFSQDGGEGSTRSSMSSSSSSLKRRPRIKSVLSDNESEDIFSQISSSSSVSTSVSSSSSSSSSSSFSQPRQRRYEALNPPRSSAVLSPRPFQSLSPSPPPRSPPVLLREESREGGRRRRRSFEMASSPSPPPPPRRRYSPVDMLDQDEADEKFVNYLEELSIEAASMKATHQKIISDGGSIFPMKTSASQWARDFVSATNIILIDHHYKRFESQYRTWMTKAYEKYLNGGDFKTSQLRSDHEFAAVTSPFPELRAYAFSLYQFVKHFLLRCQTASIAKCTANITNNGFHPVVNMIQETIRTQGLRISGFGKDSTILAPLHKNNITYPYYVPHLDVRQVVNGIIMKSATLMNSLVKGQLNSSTIVEHVLKGGLTVDKKNKTAVGFNNGFLDFHGLEKVLQDKDLVIPPGNDKRFLKFSPYRDYDMERGSLRVLHEQDFTISQSRLEALTEYNNLMDVMKAHTEICRIQQWKSMVALDDQFLQLPPTRRDQIGEEKEEKEENQYRGGQDFMDRKHIDAVLLPGEEDEEPENNEKAHERSDRKEERRVLGELRNFHNDNSLPSRRMPTDYMDELKAPKFEGIFNNQFRHMTTEQKKANMRNIYMMMGRMFFPNYLDGWQKALLLHGTAGTGKSSVLNILEGIFSKERCLSVQESSQTNFILGEGRDKDVFVFDEIEKTVPRVIPEGVMLNIIAGSSVDTTRKHESSKTVKLDASVLIASNNWPRLNNSDMSGVWYKGRWSRRFFIVEFKESPEAMFDGIDSHILKNELSNIVLKSLLSYAGGILYLRQNKWTTFVPLISDYFIKNATNYGVAHSPLSKFLDETNGWVRYTNTATTNKRNFVKHFKEYLQRRHNRLACPRFTDIGLYKPVFAKVKETHGGFDVRIVPSGSREQDCKFIGLELVPLDQIPNHNNNNNNNNNNNRR